MLKTILAGEIRDKTFGKYGEVKKVQEEKEVQECEARQLKEQSLAGK